MEHPYMTFFIVMTGITTIGNIVMKVIDLFVKPSSNVVNMTIDPTKIPGFSAASSVEEDSTVH
jgi:hypothetical protein